MKKESQSFLRSWDGYAMPIQFTYKGESEFTTTTGGIITILTQLLIFFYAGQQILYLFTQPDYNETSTQTYRDFTSNTDKIIIDTEYTTVAVKLHMRGKKQTTVTPEELVRIQFYSNHRESKDSGFTLEMFPAIQCNTLYASEMESDLFYATEFAEDDWYCPDVRNIEIYNNPFLFDTGTNFVVTVNDCTIATDKEQE